MADDPDLNRHVAQFLLAQNEITDRVVAMMAKDVHAMNAATQELANLKAAHQDLAEVQGRHRHRTSGLHASSARACEATPHPQAEQVATASIDADTQSTVGWLRKAIQDQDG